MALTVQELIDELEEITDKSLLVTTTFNTLQIGIHGISIRTPKDTDRTYIGIPAGYKSVHLRRCHT